MFFVLKCKNILFLVILLNLWKNVFNNQNKLKKDFNLFYFILTLELKIKFPKNNKQIY